jgi:hypothetical protein
LVSLIKLLFTLHRWGGIHGIFTSSFTDESRKKLKPFIILAVLQLLLAGCTFVNENAARSSNPFTGVSPIEHVASWQRVILFSACAVLSMLAALAFLLIKPVSDNFPSHKVVFLVATIPFLLGIIFSHYFDRFGFCCETPFTFFFGFPFSGLIAMKDDPAMLAYAHYGIFDLLFRSGIHLRWSIQPYPLLLNTLFWLNSSYIVCGLGALFIRPRKSIPEMTTG